MSDEHLHTPLPWEFDERTPRHHDIVGYIRGPENSIQLRFAVCTMQAGPYSRETTEANARFIVRAANNHEPLIAALRDLGEYTAALEMMAQVTSEGPQLTAARSALEAATKES